MTWAEVANANLPLLSLTFEQFFAALEEDFDHPDHTGDAARQLLDLQQGAWSVADYSIKSIYCGKRGNFIIVQFTQKIRLPSKCGGTGQPET